MKRATLIVMAFLLMAGTGLAQNSQSLTTIELKAVDSTPASQIASWATKGTYVFMGMTTEAFTVQVYAPGLIDPDSVANNDEYFITHSVLIDLTSGKTDSLVGQVQVSSLTGTGTLTLMNRAAWNSDQPGDLPIPVSQIKVVKLAHEGVTRAVGIF